MITFGQKLKKNIIKKRNRNTPNYTYLGCPLTKNDSPWCFRICVPNHSGLGTCGRIAPHTLKGNIQQGIIDYKKKKRMEINSY